MVPFAHSVLFYLLPMPQACGEVLSARSQKSRSQLTFYVGLGTSKPWLVKKASKLLPADQHAEPRKPSWLSWDHSSLYLGKASSCSFSTRLPKKHLTYLWLWIV